MSELTKQALKVDNNQSFPNNNAGLITPTNLRTFNENMIDSLVDEIGYNADSASFDTRIDALSGSIAVNTGSLLTTASFNNGTRNLTFTKGDSSTFAVNIPDITGSQLPAGLVSGSSQIDYTGISNIPAGIVSSSAQIIPLLPTGVVSGSTQVLGGTGIVSSSTQINYTGISNIPTGIVSGSSQLTASYDLRYELSGSAVVLPSGLVSSSAQINYPQISNIPAGIVSGSSQITNLGFVSASVTGSSLTTASLSGNTITFTKGDSSTFGFTIPDVSGSVLPSGVVSGSSQIDYPQISNIPAGIVSGSSQLTGSFATTSSFNAYTQSTDGRLNNIELTTASLQSEVDNLQSVTGSYLITSSFNTYTQSNDLRVSSLEVNSGSVNTSISSLNTFTASATESIVTSIVTNNGSNYYIIDGIDQPKLSFVPGPKYRFDLSGIAGNHPFKFSTSPNGPTEYTTGVTEGTGFIQIEVGYNTTTPLYYYCTNHSGMGNEINVLEIDTLATTGSNTFVGNQIINGFFTASLQQGFVYVGNASGVTTTVSTSSLGGGGGFPFTGNAVIVGSLGMSGSMFGGVIPLSITSNTASVDFSLGNMFTLTLAASATTHIIPTNIRQGQTCNIQITQPTPATGSVAFSPIVLFAGGADYQATTTGSAVDMLTIVSFNGTNTLGTSIKNFQ